MAFTRDAARGTVKRAKIASDGTTILSAKTFSVLPIENTAANKTSYPGAFTFSDMTVTNWDSTYDAGTTFDTSILTVAWFRNRGQTTT